LARVAVIENMEISHLGQLGVALGEAGAQIEIFRPWKGDALPRNDANHDAIIVLGGEQNARDDLTHPYLPALAALMRCFGDADKAVLGVCLGSQILARAYGAENHFGNAREFGWHSISINEDGRADPLLAGLDDRFLTFQWHGDTFTLPDGAVRLASTQKVANQAFRIGRATYGTQFHFEANGQVVDDWRVKFSHQIPALEPGWLERYAELKELHGPHSDASGLAIAKAWVSLI
jgi:GMP synthase (glutamine-hydrolysing)